MRLENMPAKRMKTIWQRTVSCIVRVIIGDVVVRRSGQRDWAEDRKDRLNKIEGTFYIWIGSQCGKMQCLFILWCDNRLSNGLLIGILFELCLESCSRYPKVVDCRVMWYCDACLSLCDAAEFISFPESFTDSLVFFVILQLIFLSYW